VQQLLAVPSRNSPASPLGVSRSRVFSIALENYFRARRDQKIMEQLDRV
jgi:hypothetical protein